MLTDLEQKLLTALKIAQEEISCLCQHYGEGPPISSEESDKIIQEVIMIAESNLVAK